MKHTLYFEYDPVKEISQEAKDKLEKLIETYISTKGKQPSEQIKENATLYYGLQKDEKEIFTLSRVNYEINKQMFIENEVWKVTKIILIASVIISIIGLIAQDDTIACIGGGVIGLLITIFLYGYIVEFIGTSKCMHNLKKRYNAAKTHIISLEKELGI